MENSKEIFMENVMEFHRISMEFNGIPWNFPWKSMKIFHEKIRQMFLWDSMEFHGKFMEFHGTEVDGIPWNFVN
jgi:hypothetical protein